MRRWYYCHHCRHDVDADTAGFTGSFLYCTECGECLVEDDATGAPLECDGEGGIL